MLDWSELSLQIRCNNIKGWTYVCLKDAERERRRKLAEEAKTPEEKADDKKRPRKRVPKYRDPESDDDRTLAKLFREMDEKRVQAEKIDEVVYDWTDGDFSVKINGEWYNQINIYPEAIVKLDFRPRE